MKLYNDPSRGIAVDVIVKGYSSLVEVDARMTFEQLALRAYEQIKSSFPEFEPRPINKCLFEVADKHLSLKDRPLDVSNVMKYAKHNDCVFIHPKKHSA